MNEVNNNENPNSVDPKLTQLVVAYGGMIAEKIVSGISGWEFALNLDSLFGKAIWQQVIQFQPNQIVTAFESIPEFWNRIAFKGKDYITQWVLEFIEYPKYANDAGNDYDDGNEVDEEELSNKGIQ
jgi:hypothetical protein